MCKIELGKKVKIVVVYFEELKTVEKCFMYSNDYDLSVGDEIAGDLDENDESYIYGKIIDIYSIDSDKFVDNLSAYRKILFHESNGVYCWVTLYESCDTSDFLYKENKYYVSSFYEFYPDENGNRVDWVKIGIASEKDIERDGDNWVSRNESYRFDIYDTLKEAITEAGFIADKIDYTDLPEEDMAEKDKIVAELMSNKDYLKEFNRRLEGIMVSIYNRKTKEVVDHWLYNESDAEKIEIGDAVIFNTKIKDQYVSSGVVVEVRKKKLDKYTPVPYLYREKIGLKHVENIGVVDKFCWIVRNNDEEDAKDPFTYDDGTIPFM